MLVGLPVFVAVLIALSGVLSLVTIVSIYREGGILKRLRTTPLRPRTILTAHVLVKLTLTALTMALTVLAGKRYPVDAHFPMFGVCDSAADQHVEYSVDHTGDVAALVVVFAICTALSARCSAGNSAGPGEAVGTTNDDRFVAGLYSCDQQAH